jgi:XTP/dITP diphosphohydrolase
MENKMRSRHPHVFGTQEELAQFAAQTGDEVMQNWDAHKKKEKPGRTSVMDGVPKQMPALARANKVIGKAEKAGILNPLSEPAVPMSSEEDLGRLLLAVVASARALKLDPERALREATRTLEQEVREREVVDAADAGIIGRVSDD